MTLDRLEQIEVLYRAATPGPWETALVKECDGNVCIKHEHHDVFRREARFEEQENRPGLLVGKLSATEVNVGCYLGESADAAFIAAARDAAPALVAEVRRLRALVEAAYVEGGMANWDGHGVPGEHLAREWQQSDARKALDYTEEA